MRKGFHIVFNEDMITLKAVKDFIPSENNSIHIKSSQSIETIISQLKNLHNDYMETKKLLNFESDTEDFLRKITESYLNKKRNLIPSPKNKINWEHILKDTMEEIRFQLLKTVRIIKYPPKIKQNNSDYTHDIKIVDSFINLEKQTIIILLRNNKDDRILKYIISIKTGPTNFLYPTIEVTITTKLGITVFNYSV